MTESEAIKACNTIVFAALSGIPRAPLNMTKNELAEAIRMAVKALEEVRVLQDRFVDVSLRLGEYMAIGTPEECRSAVEKQKDKTPDFEADGSYGDYGGEIVYDTWICPGCGEHYEIDYDKHEYCPCCGQKLSWENHDVTK